MPKIKKIIGNICLSIFTIIMMLVLLEIFLILFPQFSAYYSYPSGLFQNEDPPLDFVLVPNFSGKMVSPEFNIDVEINSRGLRDYEHPLNKDNNKLRILALGDSFAFGHGVELKDSFLSIIEEKLGMEIIKTGAPAWAQDNQLAYYKKEGQNYDPDVILLTYYQNDNDGNEGDKDRLVSFGSLILRRTYEEYPRWKLFLYSKLYRSRVVRLLEKSSRNLRRSENQNPSKKLIEDRLYDVSQNKDSSDWKKTKELLKEFKDLADENGKKIILAYVPYKKQIEDPSYFASPGLDINKPNFVLQEIAKDLNIPYIDVTNEIRRRNITGLYFKSDGHLNKYGHKLYGLLVAHELNKILEDVKQ